MTIITGLIFAHKIIGLSIGMLIADLGVGRVIAVFQHLFYEKMEALMFGQAFVYGSREVVVRPFTVYEEGFRETPEEFATAYSISGTLLQCYDLLNDFMPGEEEQIVEAAEISNEMYRLVIISDYAPEGNTDQKFQ